MEDRELIRNIRSGDHLAAQELHSRYVDRIFNFIYSQTNNYHDAEELLQDVFYKAARQLHRFEGRSSFKTWIFKIARNTIIDYYRKRSTRKDILVEDDTIEHIGREESAEHTALRNFHMEEVMDTIDQLPHHYRTVLHLRFIEDFTLQETAETMGKTLLSIKAMQHRARKALSKRIKMEVATDE